jgi:hypothetical protein
MTELEKAANRVVDAHKRLIFAVTPGHPDFCVDALHSDEYDGIWTEWHSATRALRDALGRTSEYA